MKGESIWGFLLPCLILLDNIIGQLYDKNMVIRKAFKYRLKVNSKTEQALYQIAGCSRFVWNKALALQKELLDKNEKLQTYNQLASLLCQWKAEPETMFLQNAPSQPLQQTLRNLDKAIKEAFLKKSPKQFPVFKKRGRHDSFRYPQGFKFNDNKVFLPKIGWVSFFKSREIEGVAKNLTVSRRGQHWFFSVQTEIEIPEPIHSSQTTIGIDMGVKRFATLSDGSYIEPLSSFKRLENKLAKEQKKLAKKVKGSNNWKKQKGKISKTHIKITDARNDFLHKQSTTISKNHAIVMLEDLQIKNMSKSAKGSIENHGKNVKTKAGLNKAILDQGWFEFRRQLEYKQAWRGGKVVTVSPQYTSQTCPNCGFVCSENRVSQAVFFCGKCGYKENADFVAARNILAVGHTVSACGDVGISRSMKQESPHL